MEDEIKNEIEDRDNQEKINNPLLGNLKGKSKPFTEKERRELWNNNIDLIKLMEV